MVRRISGRPSWLSVVAAVAALAIALPVTAQSTGMVKGLVQDDKGQPVEGAKVTIEMNGGTGRRYETKTDKKGQYMQIGLGSGQYRLKAEKDQLASAPATVTVRANTTQEANLMLGIASAAASKEAAAKTAELKKSFEDGVALSSAGKHQEAIEKFMAGAALSSTCYEKGNLSTMTQLRASPTTSTPCQKLEVARSTLCGVSLNCFRSCDRGAVPCTKIG